MCAWIVCLRVTRTFAQPSMVSVFLQRSELQRVVGVPCNTT